MHRPSPLASGLLVVALAACSAASAPSASPTATRPDGTDSASPTPAPTASTSATGGEAEILAPGVISSDDEEYRVTFSPDGAVAYFARGAGFFPQTRQATIFESRFVGGEWTEPTIAAFSGEHPDIDPWITPDGSSIYFSSLRPVDGVERNDAELFRVDRDGDGWTPPVHLAALNSERDELGASVADSGRIVFASDRPGGSGGWDLYSAEPSGDSFGDPVPLSTLNSAAWEFNPAISTDGTELVFTSIDRPGGSGLGDLFLAVRDGDWTEVGALAMNTTADEYHPSWSADGEILHFVRRSGDGDLYAVPWAEVAPKP